LKSRFLAALSIGGALLSASVLAQANGDQGGVEQEYNDALFCAALFSKLGGPENAARSERARDHALGLAPEIGHGHDEFNASYQSTAEIVEMASDEETAMFTDACMRRFDK